MAAQFVFPALVNEHGIGCIDVEHKPRYRETLRNLAGKRVEFVIRKPKSRRSTEQNAWWWGIAVPMIAEHLGYERNEHDQVHYALVSKCFGVEHDPRLGEVPHKRSSKLTVQEFSELMEWAVRVSAQEFGVLLPLPSEAEA
jgi:hypothetical protein